ncbi:MAG: D-ribose pyranase [Andreesenia angusta]|nr:D-ribose pyranase [Andreesenia angusta]
MKKNGILNSDISEVLSNLGHTDTIVVADCGFPVPEGVRKIDISLRPGEPSFLDVLKEIENDMIVEKVTVAFETKDYNRETLDGIKVLFYEAEIIECIHEDLKRRAETAKAVIRTGECTPYSNCILHAGVIF